MPSASATAAEMDVSESNFPQDLAKVGIGHAEEAAHALSPPIAGSSSGFLLLDLPVRFVLHKRVPS